MVDFLWNAFGLVLAIGLPGLLLWVAARLTAWWLNVSILVEEDVFGWRMSGLLGKDGAWFLGYSRPSKETSDA